MKATSSPAARSARTYTSVWTASTRCPRCRLPFAYGRAIVTRVRAAIVSNAPPLRAPPVAGKARPSGLLLPRSADLRQQPFREKSRIGPRLQGEVPFRAEEQRAPPVAARPSARSLVPEPGDERIGDLLPLLRKLRLHRREDAAQEVVVGQLARSRRLRDRGIPRVIGERSPHRRRDGAKERQHDGSSVLRAPQFVVQQRDGASEVPLLHGLAHGEELLLAHRSDDRFDILAPHERAV